MSKRAFDKIMQGIEEARTYLDGTADKRRYRVHVPERVDVKKIRRRLGLSQETFARTYGFALSAVRDWEQGRTSAGTQRAHPAQDCGERAGSRHKGADGMNESEISLDLRWKPRGRQQHIRTSRGNPRLA